MLALHPELPVGPGLRRGSALPAPQPWAGPAPGAGDGGGGGITAQHQFGYKFHVASTSLGPGDVPSFLVSFVVQ